MYATKRSASRIDTKVTKILRQLTNRPRHRSSQASFSGQRDLNDTTSRRERGTVHHWRTLPDKASADGAGTTTATTFPKALKAMRRRIAKMYILCIHTSHQTCSNMRISRERLNETTKKIRFMLRPFQSEVLYIKGDKHATFMPNTLRDRSIRRFWDVATLSQLSHI